MRNQLLLRDRHAETQYSPAATSRARSGECASASKLQDKTRCCEHRNLALISRTVMHVPFDQPQKLRHPKQLMQKFVNRRTTS